SDYSFIGYSLEPPASETPVIPFRQRPHRAYILAKRVQYFYQYANPMWEPSYFTRAAAELSAIWPDFEFVGGFVDDRSDKDRETQGPMPVPEGVKNLGLLDAERFDEEVGMSRLLVGLGWPTMSPSPYRALARGVPFLNPHKMNPSSTKENRHSWRDTQHATLRMIDEPYVYHTEAYDYDAFLRDIKKAMETSIPPFRFPFHSREAFDKRIRDLILADWESEAEWILKERIAGHETQRNGEIGLFEM
ncbi:hypothetical protein TREMEDRAFT_29688, partial [Tremella mesenterica DSM 1558]|uniref:uncharacterized protein n=1 Tax=Tremella mesenterica (strain ATCC 24925 / CBS 8224 / DSM 1558 / NBRC 9311 / NRRL Y-6157 / RJB 2259-6 / UBC 559-6) TaxID=578456 RepID=UPI0003F49F16